MHNRKLDDARKHQHAARKASHEAFVKSNQTGTASDRMAYMELLREEQEALEDVDAALAEQAAMEDEVDLAVAR